MFGVANQLLATCALAVGTTVLLREARRPAYALVTLLPALAGCRPTLGALRARLGVTRVLVTLRSLAKEHLHSLSPPLGLRARAAR